MRRLSVSAPITLLLLWGCGGDQTSKPQPDAQGCITVEICDGLDNDCDGEIDEDIGNIVCGIGECLVEVPACLLGLLQDCEPLAPGEESCGDLKDNDCDGVIDEACACFDEGATRECGWRSGACRPGTQRCEMEAWGTCVGSIGPEEEVCDQVDNDCDESVDEGCPCDQGDTRSCGSDRGNCRLGWQWCLSGVWGTCVGSIRPSPEACDDGLDNDCDGLIDEECPCHDGEVRPCGSSDISPCRLGSSSCVLGVWGPCLGAVEPAPSDESCDGMDDDCDGQIDEDGLCGLDGGVDGGPGDGGADGPHQMEVDSPPPTGEICDNGLDDDGDGMADCRDPDCQPSCTVGVDDTCADPLPVITSSTTITGSTEGFHDNDRGSCGGDGPDFIIRLDLARPMGVVIHTHGTSFDSVLYIRTNCWDPASEIACNDNSPSEPPASFLDLGELPAGSYHVFLDGASPDDLGPMAVTFALTEPFDEICDDGEDNDGDGLVDCDDPGCDGLACGLNGLICQEGGCTCPGGEANEAMCDDRGDNDCDGLADCDDEDCDDQSCGSNRTCKRGDCVGPGYLNWARSIGGGSLDLGQGVAVMPDGTIVMTGYFTDIATFGKGEAQETTLYTHGMTDMAPFLARYDADGALIWVKQAEDQDEQEDNDQGKNVALAPDGTILMAGDFVGDILFGEGEDQETSLSTPGQKNIFLAKYDALGNLIWAKGAGGNFDTTIYDVHALPDLGALVTGCFGADATFGAGEANESVLSALNGTDIFLARYNADGSLQWAKQAGGTLDDCGYGISAASDGSALLTGYIGDNAIFGMGEAEETILATKDDRDIFVARYSPDGTLQWARQAGGAVNYDRGTAIAALPDGSSLVLGNFVEEATFGEGEPGATTVFASGAMDIFIAQYSSEGSVNWVVTAGGEGMDSPTDLAMGPDGTILITGNFDEPYATFGQGPDQRRVYSRGEEDIFVAQYTAHGALHWVSRAGGTSENECGFGVAPHPQGGAVASGWFAGKAYFGEGEPGAVTLESRGNMDLFIARFW